MDRFELALTAAVVDPSDERLDALGYEIHLLQGEDFIDAFISRMALGAERGEPVAMFARAVALWRRREPGDEEMAIELLEPLALQGRVPAMFWLGNIVEDRDQGIRWYEAAIREGHGEALTNLAEALMARNGPGDLDTAVAWLEPRAEQGDLRAMRALADVLSRRGDGEASRSWRARAEALEAEASAATLEALGRAGEEGV